MLWKKNVYMSSEYQPKVEKYHMMTQKYFMQAKFKGNAYTPGGQSIHLLVYALLSVAGLL